MLITHSFANLASFAHSVACFQRFSSIRILCTSLCIQSFNVERCISLYLFLVHSLDTTWWYCFRLDTIRYLTLYVSSKRNRWFLSPVILFRFDASTNDRTNTFSNSEISLFYGANVKKFICTSRKKKTSAPLYSDASNERARKKKQKKREMCVLFYST